MADSFVYLTAIVVGVCAVILVITLSVIICWLIVYCKHSKVRRRKAHGTTKWKDPSILSTVSVQTKPRHASTYHDQTFKPHAAMDASGVYIFGVSGTLGSTMNSQFKDKNKSKQGTMSSTKSKQGTMSSTTSSKYRESIT